MKTHSSLLIISEKNLSKVEAKIRKKTLTGRSVDSSQAHSPVGGLLVSLSAFTDDSKNTNDHVTCSFYCTTW